LILSRDQTLV